MPAKMVPSLTDENQDLRKQIGCMNGIFQLFDRRHFLTIRGISSHHGKRPLLAGAKQQLEPHNATKAVIKDSEVEKVKARASSGLSPASYSFSSCSPTFSSLDANRTAQPETIPPRQINSSESPYQIRTMKEQKHSLTKGLQSPGIRDVVKESMYREVRGVPIKSFTNDERKVGVMKHIDSPRPLQQSKFEKQKATGYEGSPCGFAKVQENAKNSKDERLALRRLSYDGRESRDTFKMNMKLKELPRFSLDSKATSFKCSVLESRTNFLDRDPQRENKNSSQILPMNQESGSHSRSSSIVAKLMGLDDFPDSIIDNESLITNIKSGPSPGPRVAFFLESCTTAKGSIQKQVASSPPVSRKNPAPSSPRLHNANSVRKTTKCSRLPMEPAPWKQQEYSQRSPIAAQSGKAPANSRHPSFSVYGEIEKRMTELEFRKSGKDLRALKQILEAMTKTKERLESQKGESAELKLQESSLEDSCSNQNSNLSMWQNRETYQQQVVTINRTCPPKQLGSSIVKTKSAKVTEKVKFSSSNQVPRMEAPHLQNLQTQDPKYQRKSLAREEKVKYCTPRNNNMKELNQHHSSTDKKITWRNLELERTLETSPRIRVENCSTSTRGSGMVSPRVQHMALKTKRESHSNNSTSESGKAKKQSSKKVREKCPQNRKHRVKSPDLQSSDDQLSNISSETRYSSRHGDTASTKSESNNSIASHIETDVISLANSISTNSRVQQAYATTSKEHMPAVELAATMMEQPSPVSVLDTPFCSEGSPSPVKKISTAFRDESPSLEESEWHLESLNDVTDCTKSDSSYKYNQKSEDLLHLVHEPKLLKSKPNETAGKNNEPAYQSINPGHRYINKILLASGVLNDTSIIQTADQFLPSCHLINSDMFHVLEELADRMEEALGELIKKNDQMKLKQEIQRKIVSDMINEMLVHKMTSGGLFSMGRKRMGLQGLIKEIYLEMDHLCRMPCNLDGEYDGLIRLLTADMKYESDNWRDYSGEIPALVLDIERLIFKELINEVITCEVVRLRDQPRTHCRQLFTK